MSMNEIIAYEKKIIDELSFSLSKMGWTLKVNYKIGKRVRCDLALFYNDIFYTFIEIKYSKTKTSYNLLKTKGESFIKDILNSKSSKINFGILFINGNKFLVSKNNSLQLKSFPKTDDYNWRNENQTNRKRYSLDNNFLNEYDKGSIIIDLFLLKYENILKQKNLEIAELKKENLEVRKELEEKNIEIKLLRKELFNTTNLIRASHLSKEEKIQILDIEFEFFINKNKIFHEKTYKNNWCNNWEVLDSNSKIFIREAENLHEHILMDYTAYIHGFAKALENEILKKVFINFLLHFRKNKIDLDYQVIDKTNKSTINAFKKYLRLDDFSSFLSLDRMRFIISAIFSKTNDILLLEFRTVYLKYFKEMKNVFSDNGEVHKLKEIRNDGAHTKPIDKKIADTFFEMFKSTFNEFINNYKQGRG
jgi:hypothetical protein